MATPPVVSVVTPVFNCMPYLRDTLASVYHQSMPRRDVEMIAVDDGSSDGSLALLREWADRWPGLRVSTQAPSGGPSAPRNVGIRQARGEFVYFLDGDDCLGPRALERLVAMARRTHADIVLGREVGVGRKVQGHALRDNVDHFDLTAGLYQSSATLRKLFRRSLIVDNGLHFPEHVRIREDQHFVAQSYLAASTVSVVGDYDCYYAVRRKNGTNITNERLPYGTILSQSAETVDLIRQEASPEVVPHMLLRHVRRDLLQPFGRAFLARPASEQGEAVEVARPYAADWVTPEVSAQLSVPDRLRAVALQRGDLDYLLEVVTWDVDGAHARVLSNADRAVHLLAAPGLGREGADLDDDLFVVPPPSLAHHLDFLDWREGRLVLDGHAYLEGVDAGDTGLRVLARHRTSKIVVEASVDRVPSPCVNASRGFEVVDYSTAGFHAELSFLAGSRGGAELRGEWDVRVVATHAGDRRRGLLGASRARDLRGSRTSVVVPSTKEALTVATSFRQGHLRVVVDDRSAAAGGPRTDRGRPSFIAAGAALRARLRQR